MKKYLAGGNTVGSGSSGFTGSYSSKEDCSQTAQAFSAMLASRDKQMEDIWKPVVQQQTPLTQTQAQIVIHKPVQQVQNRKQVDINTILDGDY